MLVINILTVVSRSNGNEVLLHPLYKSRLIATSFCNTQLRKMVLIYIYKFDFVIFIQLGLEHRRLYVYLKV